MNCASQTEENAMAEAVFGSMARGDADQISDRDILIVDENIERLKNRSRQLTSQGWSVASYTFKKLQALAENGALFVQHLKLESKIISDCDGRLQSLLEGFNPRLTYERELVANSMLADLAQTVPDVPFGPLYAADVLYVAVRNFGVLTLAERGVHRYGYGDILDGLAQIGAIKPGAVEHLAKLRSLKSAYRSSANFAIGDAFNLVRMIAQHLPATGFPATVTLARTTEVIETDWSAAARAPYLELRDLEKRYIALTSDHPSARDDEKLAQLSRWIRDPRMYASWSARNAPSIRSRIRDISSADRRRRGQFAA